MKIENNEVFPIAIDNVGTLMDYVDGEFVFVIKDELWTPFELNALKRNTLQIDFVYKYDIAIFLLTLDDAIDTSDFIFNVHDSNYEDTLYEQHDVGTGFKCSLYLLEQTNIVMGQRKVQLSSTMSNAIIEKLKVQHTQPYQEAEFTCNLEGLQNAYEPFELQPMVLCSETFK